MTATIAEAPSKNIDQNAKNDGRRLLDRLVRVSEAPTREQAWIWPGRIPEGEITAIVGPRGAAKSYLVAEIAAKVSSGDPWPDEPTNRRAPGEVLLISAEDKLIEAIKPRLVACGADLERIHHFDARVSKDQDGNRFELAFEDVARLAEAVPGLKLIVIDPFGKAIQGQNDRRTAILDEALESLGTLAAERGLAIILVNAIDTVSAGKLRPQGLDVLPFLQAGTRALWSLEQDPGNRRRFFWLPVRTNLAYCPLGLAFSIDPFARKVQWEPEPVRLQPDDLKPRNRPSTNVVRAGNWIQKYLQSGPRRARDVLRDAALAGISRGALYEAKSQLDVLSSKETRKKVGCWHWKLAEPGQFDLLHDVLDDPRAFAELAARMKARPADDPGAEQPLAGVRSHVEPPEDSKIGSEDNTSPAAEQSKTCLRGAMADSRLDDGVGKPASGVSEDQKVPEDLGGATRPGEGSVAPRMNSRQARREQRARRRRSEDSKIQSESALAKLERAERLRPAPGPDGVLGIQAGGHCP